VRHDARIGHRRMDVGGLERDRTVARQPVGPVVEPGVERAFHEQRAKAGAVDEQIALDPPVAVEDQRRDIAALPIELDARDLAFDPLRPVGLRHPAQEARIKTRIELIGLIHAVFGQMRELALQRRLQRSEEHTSELQSLMRISYADLCLKKNKTYSSIKKPK